MPTTSVREASTAAPSWTSSGELLQANLGKDLRGPYSNPRHRIGHPATTRERQSPLSGGGHGRSLLVHGLSPSAHQRGRSCRAKEGPSSPGKSNVARTVSYSVTPHDSRSRNKAHPSWGSPGPSNLPCSGELRCNWSCAGWTVRQLTTASATAVAVPSSTNRKPSRTRRTTGVYSQLLLQTAASRPMPSPQ